MLPAAQYGRRGCNWEKLIVGERVHCLFLQAYSAKAVPLGRACLGVGRVDATALPLAPQHGCCCRPPCSVLEERALSIAAVTRKLPIALAQEGRVSWVAPRAAGGVAWPLACHQTAVASTPAFPCSPRHLPNLAPA